jgi:uncharacterized membrane protein YphA (DoxX/SURF4 family)
MMNQSKTMHYVLWVLQCLLALLFLFAGITKLGKGVAEMARQGHMSVTFLRFIGVCETLGGLGLVLPGMLRIRQGLTPLAAAGLVMIMAGAVVITLETGTASQAVFPMVTGILLTFIAYGRWRLAPLG